MQKPRSRTGAGISSEKAETRKRSKQKRQSDLVLFNVCVCMYLTASGLQHAGSRMPRVGSFFAAHVDLVAACRLQSVRA